MKSRYHSEISHSPINLQSAFEFIADEAHGGTCLFQGSVRNHNLGRDVIAVTYDVHETMAINTFTDLYLQVVNVWGDQFKVFISHYSGYLKVNGVSIVIAVSAAHRDEAFKACRFIIEGIKHNSPIWKQEHYIDGDSEWVQGHALCSHHKHNITCG